MYPACLWGISAPGHDRIRATVVLSNCSSLLTAAFLARLQPCHHRLLAITPLLQTSTRRAADGGCVLPVRAKHRWLHRPGRRRGARRRHDDRGTIAIADRRPARLAACLRSTAGRASVPEGPPWPDERSGVQSPDRTPDARPMRRQTEAIIVSLPPPGIASRAFTARLRRASPSWFGSTLTGGRSVGSCTETRTVGRSIAGSGQSCLR